jgi:predicted transposase YdaD
MPSPHDALIRRVFTRPEEAAGLIRTLHPELTHHLDLDALELILGTFIDPDLRARTTDLLFRVPTRAGPDLLLYILIEHQSTPDPWMALRMVTYQERIWIHLRATLPDLRRLPHIVPIVLYTGERPWSVPCDLADLIEPPPAGLEPPRMRFTLHVLSAHNPTDIATWTHLSVLGRLALFLLRAARARDFVQRYRTFAATIGPSGLHRDDIRALMCYLGALRDDLKEFTMNDQTLISPEREELLKTMINIWFEETERDFRAKALQEGREQGREQGREEVREEVRAKALEQSRNSLQRSVTLRLDDAGLHTPQREAALARATYSELDALSALRLPDLLAALDAQAESVQA